VRVGRSTLLDVGPNPVGPAERDPRAQFACARSAIAPESIQGPPAVVPGEGIWLAIAHSPLICHWLLLRPGAHLVTKEGLAPFRRNGRKTGATGERASPHTPMAETFYGNPLWIENGETETLSRLRVGDMAGSDELSEDYICRLAFDRPTCLPIAEIDNAYRDPLPVCKELSTPAGPLDALLVTRGGRLVLIEAKLWRNPEARRKVIGQILDYAKELQRWGYEDLQREVARATNQKGNVLYEIARDGGSNLDEATFVDTVSRSLRRGQFLLLVIGDGIREGAASIASFLQQTGTLEYTLGMVEMALYRSDRDALFVQPRVLAKTQIVERSVFEVRDERITVESEKPGAGELSEEDENQRWYQKFWAELLERIRFDDPDQPMANVTRVGNIFFSMPPSGGQVWLSAFFVQDRGEVGAYLRFASGELGDRLFEDLKEERESIDAEAGIPLKWRDGDDDKLHSITSSRTYGRGEAKNPARREEILDFLADTLNRYVNLFRPRLRRLSEGD